MKKALIVHTGGGLGDVLLSGPVVDTFHQNGFTVDFLARSGTARAVADHPHVHELMIIEGKDPAGLKEVNLWASRLKEKEYDICVLLWSTTRWAWTLFLAGIPVRVGQDSRLMYSFLFTHKVRVRSEHGDTTSHWTDILLDYPRKLGMEPSSVEPCFTVSTEDERWARATLDSFEFTPHSGPLVGFHSGKGLPLNPERWPSRHFGLLAHALQQELGARLVLTGGPDEVEIVNEVSRHLDAPYLNLAGQTTVSQLAALQRLLDVYVCPDSGPMHLAASVGTPVVGIYALDEDFPERWAPFGTKSKTVRPPRPACPPGCTKPTCPNFQCYLKVEPREVVDAVRAVLEEAKAALPMDKRDLPK
ncbi:MAG: glycosyltransferase family 9 protein [Candidatus Eremiobacteraeota bacterium]|nr:glycosyltransferase family 9 protein [Candidatus Eremiobacteraeota bacterium]